MVTLTPRAISRLSIIGRAFEVREHRASRFLFGVRVLVGACSVWVNLTVTSTSWSCRISVIRVLAVREGKEGARGISEG